MLLAEARLLAAPPAAAGARVRAAGGKRSAAPRSGRVSSPDSAVAGAPGTASNPPPAAAAGGAEAMADEAALRHAFAGVLAENGQLHLRVNAALRAQLEQRPKGSPQKLAILPQVPYRTGIGSFKGIAEPDAGVTGSPRETAEPQTDLKPKAEKGAEAAPSLAGSLFSRLVAFGGGSGGDAGGGGQPPGGGAAAAPANPKPAQNPGPAPALAARGSATSALARGAGWAAAVSGGWVGSNRGGSGSAAPKPAQGPSAAAAHADADRGMLRAPSGALDGSAGTPPAKAASGVPALLKASRAARAQPARQSSSAGPGPKAPPATLAAPGPAAGSAAASSARAESEPDRLAPVLPVRVGGRQSAPGAQGAASASPGPGLSPVSDAGDAPPAGDAPLLDFSGLTVFRAGGPGQDPNPGPSSPGGAPAQEVDLLDAWAAGVGGGGALLGEAKGGMDLAGSAVSSAVRAAASGHGAPANGQLAAGLRDLDGQQSLI